MIWELCTGGATQHFDLDKTIILVGDRFYWPSVKHDAIKVVLHYFVFQVANSWKKNTILYTSLLIPCTSWEHVSMDFVLGFPCTLWNLTQFQLLLIDLKIKCHYFFHALRLHMLHVWDLFLLVAVWLHIILRTIVFDRDIRFRSHFWMTL